MNAPTKKGALAALPSLASLPSLPTMGAMAELPDMPELPNMAEQLARMNAKPPPNPFDSMNVGEDDSLEDIGHAEDGVIDDEFKAIREGREQQRKAIELANDSEYWFAVYFQTREQKEAFLKAVKWFEHGDKYLDGRWLAKKFNVELPPRPAAYKVGRLDKKLTELT